MNQQLGKQSGTKNVKRELAADYDLDDIVPEREFAEHFGISQSTTRKLRADGMPYLRFGDPQRGRVFICIPEALAWLLEHRVID